MHDVSALWRELLADPKHWKIIKARIAGTWYGADRLENVRVSGSIFDTPTVGGSMARQLDMSFLPQGTIPRLAKIELFVALTDGARTSEDIPKGVFFIDQRSTDTETGWMTIQGFDAILMMEQVYEGPSTTAAAAMRYIADRINVRMDARTQLRPYEITDATGTMRMRQVADHIAGLHGGNWTITDTGELYLLPLSRIVGILADENGAVLDFGGVRLLV